MIPSLWLLSLTLIRTEKMNDVSATLYSQCMDRYSGLGVAFTEAMVKTQPAANAEWEFQKIFGDGDFIAAGQLRIPPHGRKPSKATKDNTYVCFALDC